MNLSSINLRFFANIAPLISGLNKAERALDQAGRKMQATGKKLTFELTAPIAAIGALSVKVFSDFEAQMSQVKAVTGASASEFEMLKKNAETLGASTAFTATEVAQLQTEFGKLGFTATEIDKVTESTLYLAQIAGSDLATAAGVAGGTLRGFGLDASETGRVADVMAMAFNKSGLDMESFADSMKYVAPVAKVANISLEETTAALGILSDNNIKGSQAGTSMRRILSELGKESGTLAEKIEKVSKRGISLENAMDEVGMSAQTALIVLQQNADKLPALTQALENSSGEAKKFADVVRDNLGGTMDEFMGSLEALALSIGQIVSVVLRPFLIMMTSIFQSLNNAPPIIKVLVVAFAALLAAIGPLLFTFGLLQRNFILMLPYLTKIGAALRFIAFQGLKVLIGPIGIVLAALAALGAIALYVGYNFEAFKVIALNAIKTLANFGIKILNNLLSVFNNVAGALGMDSVKIELFDKLETEVVPKLKSISEVAKEVKRDVAKMFGGGGAAAGGGGGVSSAAASFDELIGTEGGETGAGGTGVAGAVKAFGALTKVAPKAMHAVSISVANGVKKMIVPIESMTEKQFKLIEATRQMEKDISSAITGAATSFAIGMAEMIGASIAGGQGIQNFGMFALQSLAGLLQSVGEMAIQTGIALLGIQVALKTLNPYVAIAAGIALVALASGIRTSLAAKGNSMGGIPALAEGGIATGPTLALIGEGKGPEAVIPLDKLEGMMGGGFGNGQNVVVTGRIQGSDILISSERAERQRSRYRGF
jgi:phage-related minor tail protein